MNPLTIIFAVLGLLACVLGIFMRRRMGALTGDLTEPQKKAAKRRKTLWTVLAVLGGWAFTVELIAVIFGPGEPKGDFTVEITPERIDVFGLSVSSTVLVSWGMILAVLVLALIFRFVLFPKFKEIPDGWQNAVEIAVEWIDSYTDSKVENAPGTLGSYIFTVGVFMVISAVAEAFGLRAPTSDITVTLSMALWTFFFINFYGIRRKGVGGRIRSLASPTPMVFPLRVVCDLAVPVSLACRLFGNMLGGMIVMDLLYYAMGQAAVGLPSVVGLYFNVFHPLIQAFIFITLSLTFINEAVETAQS